MRSVLSRSTLQRCRPAAVVLIASLVVASGCVDSPVAPPVALPAAGASLAAGLELDPATAALAWSTGPTWSLNKTGALSGGVVTWTIVATEGPVAPGPLVVHGVLPLSNPGDAPAPIGNIAVNLQTRSGNVWSTASSNIADATDGDDATAALIQSQASSEGKASFGENAASGSLQFMDATSNTAVSLVPQVVISAGETRTLRYRATFDPNALGIAAGTPVRIEVLVSYGNAPPGNSTPNLDIDGSGTVDASEARVRSAATRLGVTVPDAVPGSGTVTLVDGLDDISTTGTVTFSNAQFTLGATDGTVAVTVDGGTDGGTITNCAKLTGAAPNGGDLTDCSTVPIAGAASCTPGAPGCNWNAGDLVTFSQADWVDPSGASPVAFGDVQICGASPLANMSVREFLSVANTALGGGSTGYAFSDLHAIALQLNGSFRNGPSPFAQAHLITGSCSTGEEAGDLLTFGQGDWGSTSGIAANLMSSSYGPVYFTEGGVLEVGIRGLTGFSMRFGNALAVTSYLPATGAPAALISDLVDPTSSSSGSLGGNTVALKLNVDFSDAGRTGGAGPRLLLAHYAGVYFSAGAVLEVGVLGTAGFSMRFGNVESVVSYLPATGAPSALTGDLVDPTTSPSGSLGGNTVALKLNVDFSDAGLTGGTAPVSFGDVWICGAVPLANMTVRDFLVVANTALGGGSTGYAFTDLDSIATQLNGSFRDGPSAFAQQHLVMGSCP